MPVSSWCRAVEFPGDAEYPPGESVLGVGVSDCMSRGKSLIALRLGAFAIKEIPHSH